MDFLKSIAPWIATAATGGVPALIGLAAKELTDALGNEVEPTQEGITRATASMTHEQILAVKQADYAFQTKMAELGYNTLDVMVKAEVSDKANARQMQVEALKQDSWFAKNFVYLLASFWTVAAIVYIGFVTFGNIPTENVRFADTILGFLLGTVIATIINFFMGTSFSSRVKDESINRLTKNENST